MQAALGCPRAAVRPQAQQQLAVSNRLPRCPSRRHSTALAEFPPARQPVPAVSFPGCRPLPGGQGGHRRRLAGTGALAAPRGDGCGRDSQVAAPGRLTRGGPSFSPPWRRLPGKHPCSRPGGQSPSTPSRPDADLELVETHPWAERAKFVLDHAPGQWQAYSLAPILMGGYGLI